MVYAKMIHIKSRKYGLLGQEIEKHLKRKRWSQRALAREAGIASSTISNIMRDEHRPTPETIDAIANVLGLDPVHLMRLAGMPVPVSKKRNPSIEYIAQRLDDLPTDMQKKVVEILGAQLEAFIEMWEREKLLTAQLAQLEKEKAALAPHPPG